MHSLGAGPVVMAASPIGTVYMYEAGADDLRAYAAQGALGTMARVRWLLPRVASLANGGPLTDDAVASLQDADIERLAEQYAGSPENQQRAQRLGSPALARGASESAVAWLDRLLRQPLRLAAEAGAPPPVATAPARERGVASWAIAALVMGALLSGLAALFSYRAYEREGALQAEAARDRAQAKAQLDRQGEETLARIAALQAQNTELRQRLDRLERAEARATRSPARPPAPATRAPTAAKSRTQTRR